MFKFITRCSCGCNEIYKGIKIGNNQLLYFTDCGNWWIKFETLNKQYSYSPCQGFIKNNKINGGI